ncbi:MAG: PD-(D/E)XK nuclease family protein, partial [Actinobacteria bacterium]|nr:PD-(D/E)XK nuclease family protein [Actinomycetota bacterium]
AVAILAHLHRAGVRVANPDSWYGAREISSEIPLFSEEEPIKISPSSLDTLNKCALKWAFEHAGGRDSDSTSQILGTALHFVATKLITKAPLSELLTDLETIWQKLAEQTDLAKGWYGQAQLIRAREIVENIFTYHSESDRELVAVEAPFTITQERTVIKGSIDRLEKTKENKAFVVDLKTGESAVSKKDAQENLQLKVYQLAVNLGQFSTLLPEATAAGAELFYPAVNVAGANRPQDEIVDSEVSESITKLSDIAAATKFLAVENELCRSCHLRNSCPVKPEGRALR